MEIIIYDPNKLNKIIDNPITDYQFTFLNEYNDYISILEIYKYLRSLEKNQYNNLWNFMIIQWNKMHKILKDDSLYKKSKYYHMNYNQIHKNIKLEDLEIQIYEFIGEDKMKLIFFVNCIMLYSK